MTPRLKPITNRATDGSDSFQLPSDNWYLIAPLGDFPHDASGFVQVIDAAAVAAMAKNFQPGDELLVDWDHLSLSPDEPTAAAGWIQQLQSRDDGLYARIRWSTSGRAAVAGGEYRFISPVWNMTDCEQIGDNRIRPLRLAEAGLTNRPNLIGISPLTNRTQQEIDRAERPRIARDAVDEFASAVHEYKNNKGVPFSSAYESVKLTRADLYQKLLNRLIESSPGTALATKIKNAFSPNADLQPLSAPPPGAGQRFLSLVHKHQKQTGKSFEKAWDIAAREHRFEYGNALRESGMPHEHVLRAVGMSES